MLCVPDSLPTKTLIFGLIAFALAGAAQAQVEPTWSEDFPRLSQYGEAIYERFDSAAAFDGVTFVDQFFRSRGNAGYQSSLQYVYDTLLAGGFSNTEVELLPLGPALSAWTPQRASLSLLDTITDERVVLHAFDNETEQDRATLLVDSASIPLTRFTVVEAGPSAGLTSVAGRVVLGTGEPWELFGTYVLRGGAAGILTQNLEWYHQADAHRDVAQFGYLPVVGEPTAFGFSVSPSAFEQLQTRIQADGEATIEVEIEVEWSIAQADTLQATIVGNAPEEPPIVFLAHVDEPGANDNASGVAAALELALTLRRGIEEGTFPSLQRSIVFLWGQEFESAEVWAETVTSLPFAVLTFDMVGADPDVVEAPFLIERMPDPGAIWLLPPDEHTAWGAIEVDASQLRGHFLTDLAVVAASLRAQAVGPWDVRTNPYEGGSDHDPFLDIGVPAILGWHFTDSAYHTNLDRTDRISGEEMRRVAASFGAAALSMAVGEPEDVGEILRAVSVGAEYWRGIVELAAQRARDKGSSAEHLRIVAESWLRWYDGAFESVLGVSVGSPDPDFVEGVLEVRTEWLLDGAEWLGPL